MRTPHELMLFVALAGVVVLMALWTIWRWRRGDRDPDPAARLVAVLALVALSWLLAFDRWAWIPRRYGAAVWVGLAGAAALLVADWVRERAARRARRDELQTPR
ncbi:MAG: hypothetical protein ACREMB_23100 [Candidatus Rokuibacteriota bacterium]